MRFCAFIHYLFRIRNALTCIHTDLTKAVSNMQYFGAKSLLYFFQIFVKIVNRYERNQKPEI